MTDQQQIDPFEHNLALELRAYSGLGVGRFDAGTIAARARTAGAPAMRLAQWLTVSGERQTLLRLALLAGLLALAAGLALVAMSGRPREVHGLLAITGGNDAILLLDPTTGVARQIAEPYMHDAHPVWAPDGLRIAVVQGDGRGPVRVVDADGGNTRIVGEGLGASETVTWSPDGTTIAFAGYMYPFPEGTADHEKGLYVASGDGGSAQLLVPGRFVHKVAWSPTGSMIAFTVEDAAGWSAYVVDVQSGALTRVSDPFNARDYQPLSWAPDESAFAYARHAPGVMAVPGGIVVVDRVAGAWRERLIVPDEPGTAMTAPVFLPNGRLLFVHGDQLWVISADGSGARVISDVPVPVPYADGCLAPDGSAFVLPIGGPDHIEDGVWPRSELVIVDLEHDQPPLRIVIDLPGHGDGPFCSWQPTRPAGG